SRTLPLMPAAPPPISTLSLHDALPISDFCLLLEDVQDPGNVGSMLRSAAAAGVAQVFLSPGCAFAWSPKVLRAGQGAHFNLEIQDRKSTRLNSSHVSISYAVFCLKKKI